MNEPFDLAIEYFNRESYRDALLAFEECWFDDRSDFLRGLIQVSNALNQLRMGLITAPRRTLASAAQLLAPYAPTHCGLDVAALCADIDNMRAHIPDDIESGKGRVAWDKLPRLRLRRSLE